MVECKTRRSATLSSRYADRADPVRNFRAFKDVELRDVPWLAILVGANGTGKSTLFAIFGFLQDAMNSNVRTALTKAGRQPRFREVRSRAHKAPSRSRSSIGRDPGGALITYRLGR